MKEKVLFITDPFDDLNIKKDTSMLLKKVALKKNLSKRKIFKKKIKKNYDSSI